MLTSRDLQQMLQVDRSTIYRMAEAGSLPAVKVGRQWRFPSEAIERWLDGGRGSGRGALTVPSDGVMEELVPVGCVQPVLDVIADMLGVMLVVTDMNGVPVSEVSNPCGLFAAVAEIPGGTKECIAGWQSLAGSLHLEPRFTASHLGLLCARTFVRIGAELKGMVIAGGITPDQWPPTDSELDAMAAGFGADPGILHGHVDDVYRLDERERSAVLDALPGIGYMISEITTQHLALRQKLETIASLAGTEQ